MKPSTFTRKKNNAFNCNNRLCGRQKTRNDSMKDLWALLDSKIFSHRHVECIFSQSFKILRCIRTLTFCYSAANCLLLLHYTLVRPKNVHHLSGITLRLLMKVSRHTTNRSLQRCASVTVFMIFLIIILLHVTCFTYFKIYKPSPWFSLLHSRFRRIRILPFHDW